MADIGSAVTKVMGTRSRILRLRSAPGAGIVEADAEFRQNGGEMNLVGLARIQRHPRIGRDELKPFGIGDDRHLRPTPKRGAQFLGHRDSADSGAEHDDLRHLGSSSSGAPLIWINAAAGGGDNFAYDFRKRPSRSRSRAVGTPSPPGRSR